jgi:hypothetical protein
MKHRIVMLAMAFVAFLSVGMIVVPGQAQAAVGTYIFALHQSGGEDNYCLVSTGVGHQVEIGYAGGQTCAEITITQNGTQGNNTVYQFRNANGNCIRANSSDEVKIAMGACSQYDEGADWVVTNGTIGGTNVRFQNLLTLLWLKTDGFGSGYDVIVGTGGENNWDLF